MRNIFSIDNEEELGCENFSGTTITLEELTTELAEDVRGKGIYHLEYPIDKDEFLDPENLVFLDASKKGLDIGKSFIKAGEKLLEELPDYGFKINVDLYSINLDYEDWHDGQDEILYDVFFKELRKILSIDEIFFSHDGAGNHTVLFSNKNKLYNFCIIFQHDGDGYTLFSLIDTDSLYMIESLYEDEVSIRGKLYGYFKLSDVRNTIVPKIDVKKAKVSKDLIPFYLVNSSFYSYAKKNKINIKDKKGFFNPRYTYDISKLKDIDVEKFITSSLGSLMENAAVGVQKVTNKDKDIRLSGDYKNYDLYLLVKGGTLLSKTVVLQDLDNKTVSVLQITNEDLSSLTLETSTGKEVLTHEGILNIFKGEVTVESSKSIGCDTLQELQTFLSKESKLVVGNAAILTTEGSYVSNVKNFFLDSIDNLLTKITVVKNNWLHDYKFKDRASDLRKLTNTISDISDVPMSKVRTLSVPVSLGMSSDYYTISNKIVNLPDILSAHTVALKAFREELQKLIANRKGERLRISNKVESESFTSIDRTEDTIRTIVKHNDTKDLRKVEEVFPNLKVVENVKSNFVSACQGIVDNDTIGKLVKEVDATSEVLKAWTALSKESKERYGSNVIQDIGWYSDHLAKAVTNAGTLIALLDQHSNFFIRDIKIIEKNV